MFCACVYVCWCVSLWWDSGGVALTGGGDVGDVYGCFEALSAYDEPRETDNVVGNRRSSGSEGHGAPGTGALLGNPAIRGRAPHCFRRSGARDGVVKGDSSFNPKGEVGITSLQLKGGRGALVIFVSFFLQYQALSSQLPFSQNPLTSTDIWVNPSAGNVGNAGSPYQLVTSHLRNSATASHGVN